MKYKNLFTSFLMVISLSAFIACSTGPRQLEYGKDACSFCKMSIMDERFAAQCYSMKGKHYKFDDAHCLIAFLKNGGIWRNELGDVYFAHFSRKETWIKSDSVLLVKCDSIRSPMGGNLLAFSTEQERDELIQKYQGEKLLWKDVNPFAGK